MKNKKLLIVFIGLTVFIFNQCKKDTPKTLSVSVTSENVTKNAESFTFSVLSNIDWKAGSNSSWCVLSVSSGSGNGTVTVNISENNTTIQRTAIITLSGSDVNSVTITVNQEAGTTSETVTDFDGNIYHTVQIGNQVWMTENLKVTHYPDGTEIPLVTDDIAWADLADNNTDDAYCRYNNDTNSEYGILYTWAAAMGDNAVSSDANPSGVQGICPAGWHIPSDAEWTELSTYLGGEGVAGGKLKESGTVHWNSPNTGADNSSGFTALPGGLRGFNGGFHDVGLYGYWWSSTENTNLHAWFRRLDSSAPGMVRDYYNKSNGYSVRCIKN